MKLMRTNNSTSINQKIDGIIRDDRTRNIKTVYEHVLMGEVSPTSPSTSTSQTLLYSPTTATTVVIQKAFDKSALARCNPNNTTCSYNNTENSPVTNHSSDEEDLMTAVPIESISAYFCSDDGNEVESEDSTCSEETSESYSEEEESIDEEFNWVPFWFGYEEPCHASKVLKDYSTFLKLNSERGPNSRLPTQFIGKIRREILHEDSDEEDNQPLLVRTFDEVYIYEKTSSLVYGSVNPLLKRVCLETTYDFLEGLPVHFVKRKYLEKPKHDELNEFPVCSWLYCRPIYASEDYGFESVYGDESHDGDIGFGDLFNRCLQQLRTKGNKDDSGTSSCGIVVKLGFKQESEDYDDEDDSDHDGEDDDSNDEDDDLPSYMQDLQIVAEHLVGFGYFEDDK